MTTGGLSRFRARNHPQQTAKRTRGIQLFEYDDEIDDTDLVDDRGTPKELFESLDDEFDFTIDVASSHENTKCVRHYTMDDNALIRDWRDEMVWCNPPYSDLRSWVAKADSTMAKAAGGGIVMLLPANRTEQSWWHDFIEPFRDGRGDWRGIHLETRFILSRVRFVLPGDVVPRPNSRPPFGSVLCIWSRC